MSIWPFLSVSFPRDQPVKYFAAEFSILAAHISHHFVQKIAQIPSRSSGRFPRYEEYESKRCLNCANSGGTSLTIMIPNELGPKAFSSVEN